MFFKELHALLGDTPATLRIMAKGEQMTVSIIPDSLEKVSPILAVGTAEQLDEKFIEEIKAPIISSQTLIANFSQYEQQLKEADEAKKAEVSKKKPTAPATKGKKPTVDKTDEEEDTDLTEEDEKPEPVKKAAAPKKAEDEKPANELTIF
ncbi:PRTRC_E, PRTRC system protein E [uncultured Caudovirales phage]|uniref:PRTRC_E, PRTRC system protein E n=1 Tax=uncultured Caudovirales phage TaxID=2100421 RepID=A0A6J5KVC3_9CAUD|nr:PRTRC_E, PRTRC system protein E [uncultured Caudovirales phage]